MNHTLKMVRKLESEGFTTSQAECMVEVFMETIQQSDLVTKSFFKGELAELKAEFSREHVELKSELKSEFSREHAELKSEFSRELAELRTESSRERAEMKSEFSRELAGLRTESSRERAEMKTEFSREIAQLEKNLIRWMLGGLLSLFGAIAGMAGLILGLIYFLHR